MVIQHVGVSQHALVPGAFASGYHLSGNTSTVLLAPAPLAAVSSLDTIGCQQASMNIPAAQVRPPAARQQQCVCHAMAVLPSPKLAASTAGGANHMQQCSAGKSSAQQLCQPIRPTNSTADWHIPLAVLIMTVSGLLPCCTSKEFARPSHSPLALPCWCCSDCDLAVTVTWQNDSFVLSLSFGASPAASAECVVHSMVLASLVVLHGSAVYLLGIMAAVQPSAAS